MEATDRAGAASLVQKQMEQIELSGDGRERGSMVLVDSFIGDEGAVVVTEALRSNYTVRSLDMRGCNLRADGAGAACPRLRRARVMRRSRSCSARDASPCAWCWQWRSRSWWKTTCTCRAWAWNGTPSAWWSLGCSASAR